MRGQPISTVRAGDVGTEVPSLDSTERERNMPLAGLRKKPTCGNQPGARTKLPARVAMLGDIGCARHRSRESPACTPGSADFP